jgi:hypothetical protein
MGDLRITKDVSIIGVAYNPRYGFDFGDQLHVATNQGVAIMPPGLDSPKRAAQVASDLQNLAANGVNAISVKIFADGRTGINFDPKDPGRALGVQTSVYDGLNNLISAAAAIGIAVHLVLFDHLFVAPPEGLVDTSRGVRQTGPERKQGHLRALADPDNRALLLQNVIAPVLDHLGASPNLLSVELINEPESILESMQGDQVSGIPRSQTAAFKDFMRDVRDLVHDRTGAQFTVGTLGLGRRVMEWVDVIDPKQDYLSVHYYANSANGDPSYRNLYSANSEIVKLQRAGVQVVFGEYAANGYGSIGAEQFLKDAHEHGVNGGFAWAMYDGEGNQGEKQLASGTANFGPLPLDDFRRFHLLNSLGEQRSSTPPQSRGLWRSVLGWIRGRAENKA